jgi:hypothetical protein
MADGGLLLGAVCVLAALTVVPTALAAAWLFDYRPRGDAYVARAWGRHAPLWTGGAGVAYPGGYPRGAFSAGASDEGCAYVRVPVPRDGAEYLLVRADVFADAAAGAAAHASAERQAEQQAEQHASAATAQPEL